jgi:hypothetical protein
MKKKNGAGDEIRSCADPLTVNDLWVFWGDLHPGYTTPKNGGKWGVVTAMRFGVGNLRGC